MSFIDGEVLEAWRREQRRIGFLYEEVHLWASPRGAGYYDVRMPHYEAQCTLDGLMEALTNTPTGSGAVGLRVALMERTK